MSLTTLGDLTSHFMLRRHNAALRSEMLQLSRELTTGQTADPIRHLAGDFAVLADIEQKMTLNAAFRQAAAEAITATDAMQTVLGAVQDNSLQLAGSLMTLSDSGLLETGRIAADEARDLLDQAISLLNTQVGGRSLFAGDAVAGPALIDGSALLTELETVTAGLTFPVDITSAVDAWFDSAGGGFDTVAYLGSDQPIPPFRVASDQTVSLDLRADNMTVRQTLKPLVIAALAGSASLGLDHDQRNALYRDAGARLYEVQDGLTALRADLGVTEARLEETVVRLGSEKLSLEQARGGLLNVDPYETASRLEQVQFNLESLYTLTVRMSRLSLTEYM